jgi:hypothetical protein
MRRIPVLLLFAAAVLAPAFSAQSSDVIVTTVPECLPTTTLDEMVKALDDAISGPANKDRTCLRQVLLPEARLTPMAPLADGGLAPHTLTVDNWVAMVGSRGSIPIYERQVKVGIETYGHIAHLWTTYELRPTPDGKATARGINSIQAVFDGKRWRVFEILWQAETREEPVPAKYLP